MHPRAPCHPYGRRLNIIVILSKRSFAQRGIWASRAVQSLP